MLTKINIMDNASKALVSEENSWLDYHKPFEDQEQIIAMEHNVDASFKALDVAINHYEYLKDKENVSQEELAVYNNFLVDVYKACGVGEESYSNGVVVSEEGIIDGIKNVITAVFEFIKKIFQWIGDMIGKFIDWMTGLFKSSKNTSGGGSSSSAISSKADETEKLEEEVKNEGKEDEYKEELEKIVTEREFSETALLAIWCFNRVARKNLIEDNVAFDVISNIDDAILSSLDSFLNKIKITAKILSENRKNITGEFDCNYVETIKKEIENKNQKDFTDNLTILGLDDLAEKINKIAQAKYKNRLLYIKYKFINFSTDKISMETVIRGVKTKKIICGTNKPETTGFKDTISESVKINNKLKVTLNTTLDIKNIKFIVNKTIEDKLDKYHMGIIDAFRNIKSIVEEYNKKVNKLKDLKIDFGNKEGTTNRETLNNNNKFTTAFLQIYKENLKASSVEVTNLMVITQKLIILEESYLREIKTSYLEILKAKELAAKKALNKS